MASQRISDLTTYTTPQPTDIVPIVDITNDITKKISVSNLTAQILAPVGNLTVAAGYAEMSLRSFTVASGKILTIGSGARIRIF